MVNSSHIFRVHKLKQGRFDPVGLTKNGHTMRHVEIIAVLGEVMR